MKSVLAFWHHLDRVGRVLVGAATVLAALSLIAGVLAQTWEVISPTRNAVLGAAGSTLATGFLATAVYAVRWRNRALRAEADLVDAVNHFMGPPLPPSPVVQDYSSFGQPPLSNAQLALLIHDCTREALTSYSDSSLAAIRIAGMPTLRPSIIAEIEFHSAHADRRAIVHWDNYHGVHHTEVGIDPRRGGGDARLPFDVLPTTQPWELGYRLAFERAQPLSTGHGAACVLSAARNDVLFDNRDWNSQAVWSYYFEGDSSTTGTVRGYGLCLTTPPTVEPASSVYAVRFLTELAFARSSGRLFRAARRSEVPDAILQTAVRREEHRV